MKEHFKYQLDNCTALPCILYFGILDNEKLTIGTVTSTGLDSLSSKYRFVEMNPNNKIPLFEEIV